MSRSRSRSQSVKCTKKSSCPKLRSHRTMSRSRSRSQSIKCTRKSSMPTGPFRSGRVTRNPFLNFLRDFRKYNTGLTLTELAKRAGELWRKMNSQQKSPYCKMAKQAPKVRHRRKSWRKRRRNRSRSQSDEREHRRRPKRKRSCSRSKDKSSLSRSRTRTRTRTRTRSKSKSRSKSRSRSRSGYRSRSNSKHKRENARRCRASRRYN